MPSIPADAFDWAGLRRDVARDFALADRTANCAVAVPLLDAYAASLFVTTLQTRGLFTQPGASHADHEIQGVLRPVPAMCRLLSACLDVLARQGWLQPEADGFRAADRIVTAEAERLRVGQRLLREHPDKAGIVTVIDRTVPRLPDALAGEVAPTDVIFPDGSMDLVLGYYQGHPLAVMVNRSCAMAVGRIALWLAAGRGPGHTVRLLEVGAGTGTTTVSIMAELAPTGLPADYVFSDLSGAFVSRARRSLGAAHPAMRFTRYDIEAPAEASAGLGQFDIIVAANAVHATADIAESLRHLAARLSPGGLLVLNEITTPQDHLTLAFGILPGWWRATDPRSAAGPLLTEADWRARLMPLFETRLIAGPGAPGNPLQSLIIASLRNG